ncbi:MAG: hypothetical protein DPW09_03585 [Anaerolineae bacterium]|nr:hypothetical protein [Anaerolineae bacterium]
MSKSPRKLGEMAKKKLSHDQKRAQKNKKQVRHSQAPLGPGQRLLNRPEKAGLGIHKLMRRVRW